MDVFDLHQQIVNDYAEYANSFVTIQDHHIAQKVEEAIEKGAFWPEPPPAIKPNLRHWCVHR